MTSSKHCLYCNNEILSGDKRKKFCDSSCSASYNNSKFPRKTARSTSICSVCGKIVCLKKKPGGGYYNRKFCDGCIIHGSSSYSDLLINQTKGSLYAKTKGWQPANNSIRRHSRQVYWLSKKPRKCMICGYDKYIEICHIKQVKEFPNEAKIIEINDIANLAALCPNHHWEFDNKLLKLSNEDASYCSQG